MKLLLATLHARYIHNSLALPCLAAVCMGIEGISLSISEFTVNEPSDGVLRRVVAEEANVVVFSCYIWNINETLRIIADLKRLSPDTFIVLGGPEASYGAFELMANNPAIDCVVCGEGEETFRELISLLAGNGLNHGVLQRVTAGVIHRCGEDIVSTPRRRVIADLDTIPSPFSAALADLSKPLVYYESSRGCPFSCAFCISSLEREVRSFSMARIQEDLGTLMAQDVQTVKFVDRTFNYDAARANAVWEFILRENRTSRFHFEIAADLLTEANFDLLRQVPPSTFRFEIGVQSGEVATLARVGRISDIGRLCRNVDRLRRETKIQLHLDLVAGLPEEDMDGFLRSLQLLFAMGSGNTHEPAGSHIQVELLKVLKGTAMARIASEEGYAWSATPPYQILRTPWLSYREICRIETMGRLIDLVYNSGRFNTTLAAIGTTWKLADFFSALAAYWEQDNLPTSLSRGSLFQLLWRFIENSMAKKEKDWFRDPLCFDFCLGECPSTSALPEFFRDKGEWGKEKDIPVEIATTLRLPAGARVRSFRKRFEMDYLSTPWGEGPVEFLFVYASAKDYGLKVEVVRLQ